MSYINGPDTQLSGQSAVSSTDAYLNSLKLTFIVPSAAVLPHGCYFSGKRKAGEEDWTLPLRRRVHLGARHGSDFSPDLTKTPDVFTGRRLVFIQSPGLWKTQSRRRSSGVYFKTLNLPTPHSLNYGTDQCVCNALWAT